jgi:UDP-N-acetylglucosamine--N-acetylmuramyl-(pentapeptide) pyrophosphoryl-undecaprenol N-acetylglucosamine transferase
MSKEKKLAILCGGTGGHFYPGLTIARKHIENGGSVELFLSGKHSGNQAEIAEQYGIESTLMPQLTPPVGLLGKCLFSLSLLKSVFIAIKYLRREKPDAVLGMGSFTSFPTALAAKLLWIPLYIHDGNARVGKANVFLSRWAEKTMLSFPAVNKDEIRSEMQFTGMPVRPELHADTFKQQTRKSLIGDFNEKFNAEFKIRPKIILVFGGSQGAAVFNDMFPTATHGMENNKFQVIHLVGKGNEAEVQMKYKNAKFAYKVIESTENMSLLYSMADIIFCRSGGSTIAELALFAKFAILVPYPYATDDHQSYNADYYCSKGSAIKVKNSDCTPEKFRELLNEYLENPAKFAEAGEKGAELAKPYAAEDVLKNIF